MGPANIAPGEKRVNSVTAVVAIASGQNITTGTVNYELKATSGTNNGLWYKGATSTWEATAQSNAMTHSGNGFWALTFTNSPFADGVYYEYAVKESGGLNIGCGGSLLCQYTPSADSSRRPTALLSVGMGAGQVDVSDGMVAAVLNSAQYAALRARTSDLTELGAGTYTDTYAIWAGGVLAGVGIGSTIIAPSDGSGGSPVVTLADDAALMDLAVQQADLSGNAIQVGNRARIDRCWLDYTTSSTALPIIDATGAVGVIVTGGQIGSAANYVAGSKAATNCILVGVTIYGNLTNCVLIDCNHVSGTDTGCTYPAGNAKLVGGQVVTAGAPITVSGTISNLTAAQVQTQLEGAGTKITLMKAVTDQMTFASGYLAVQVRGMDTGVITASKFAANAFTATAVDQSFLAKFANADTGETDAAAGSVAKLSQGAAGGGGATDWTDAERAQIRHQLGIDGTSTAPSVDAPDPIVILPPDEPDYATGYLLDQTPGTVYTFRRVRAAGTAGYGWSEEPWTVTADDAGLVEYAFAFGHTYEGSRADGAAVEFLVPSDGEPFALPEMLSEAP